MALSSLGKRSRVSESEDVDFPLKRPRRQTRNFVINDENQDPESVTFEDALTADSSTSTARGTAKRRGSLLSSPTKSSPAKGSVVPLTPSTPRFRNGLVNTNASTAAVETPATPVTPSTPRFRVMSAGKLSRRSTPQSVARYDVATPMTPHTPSGVQTVYHKARQLFARSAGGTAGALVGRDEERERLRTFLHNNCSGISKKSDCGCLYVSGPPGTGKSAMVNEMTEEVCAEMPGVNVVRKAYINCMSIRSSSDLYSTLLRQLVGVGPDGDEAMMDAFATETDVIGALQALLVPKKNKAKKTASTETTYLVVLDEIDHILTLDLESLYRVIEWSMLKTSRLVLVGIANALDLTDRFLPRLKSRNLQPELLPFLPYTVAQIKNIITTRLKSVLPPSTTAEPANFLPFFHPAAVELCARKVASQTGDLRKAFEILRRALDLVEAEAKEKYLNEAREETTASLLTMTPTKKKQPLAENMNLASSSPSAATPLATPAKRSSWSTWAAQNLTVESAPRVSIGHLNKVTSAAFGNGAQQRLRGLNLQQKAALCALMAFEKWNRETHAQAQKMALASPSSTAAKRLVKAPRTPSSSVRAGATAAPTVKTLFDSYSQMCKRDAVLHPLSSSEFREVVSSLETLSLVTAVDGRTGSFAVLQTAPGTGSGRRGRRPAGATGGAGAVTGDERRVASCVGEKELQQALDGAGADILRSILSGEALD